ncbi:hypothetical protein P154DRAFT_518014 [Amniculicola lignicola CBS 123094]|uniref:Uncharacterized protein n=1 Tax=Amniculicola lignicola CBS 123094 TaxID=1392246 RepID=A0A6A5WX55_9PLEO|nr:hypothetical protein P154DRAFT_518014 [Amniculicola lignicola CBS 123094]
MASTIASPIPLSPAVNRPTRKDVANLQLHEGGRDTPLPQYEKTQAVPFTLTLQEEKSNPGHFQLVVNVNTEHKEADGNTEKPQTSKQLFANLQSFPSLGYNVSSLYQTQKSSPPTTPQQDRQGWSDLDAIPPEFLQKVVPDWKVSFSRSDSNASAQSRRLSDIKARIKKSGKGFVVRLLKGSNAETNEVAEVQLGHTYADDGATFHELDSSSLRAELDSTGIIGASTGQGDPARDDTPTVFEIGSSNEPGIQRQTTTAPFAFVAAADARPRNSICEEGFSDAETLTQDIAPFGTNQMDELTDAEPYSTLNSRSLGRATSIVKTPTRGLSVVGPVRRVGKNSRSSAATRSGRLIRSDAQKSFRRRSPRSSNSNFAIATASSMQTSDLATSGLRQRQRRDTESSSESREDSDQQDHDSLNPAAYSKEQTLKAPSREGSGRQSKQKATLTVQTDVPRPRSANSSPVTKRKRPAHHRKASSNSTVTFEEHSYHPPSPAWSEVDPSEELREALERAFGDVRENLEPVNDSSSLPIPRIEEPVMADNVGEIPLPTGLEIRSAPVNTGNPMLTFWSLALDALIGKAVDGLQLLRDRYGREPAIPPNHVRVRWTCSCGEPLYDDFIERRPGAARLLEAYLNRPRAHTPTSPSGRASSSSTMSSVFSSASRASTLATPASTYGGTSSWGRGGDSAKYSPTRIRSSNPFSVRIGTYVEEQWLLTCANEGRFTPKIVHIDVNPGRIKSDKDFALAIREHYEQLNRKWLGWAKLRGLTTIEFSQFEVHRNRFADIRASPSMPPSHSLVNSKAPSEHPYSFEPVDLVPPVGSTYLLHLFKHPSDYDTELVTYLRSPKRRERLEYGMGWGINLVEGFLAQKVWLVMMLGFGVGSAVFAVLWTVKKGDVQGAFGVAGWVVTLAGLMIGGLQGWAG